MASPRPPRPPGSNLSLAAMDPGDTGEITRILFDALRNLCGDLGLNEGDMVRCRAATPTHLLLDTAVGRTVSLERDWARFIQVSGTKSPRRYRRPIASVAQRRVARI